MNELVTTVGWDVSLPAVVKAMVKTEVSWDAGVSFCELVMVQKETVEREREITTDIAIRRRRPGRRRRLFHALLQPPYQEPWAAGAGGFVTRQE